MRVAGDKGTRQCQPNEKTKQGGEPVESISLLTTLDQKYLPQLRTLLTSLSINNPGEIFDVFLFHSGLTKENLSDVQRQCNRYGYNFLAICVEDALFQGAPVTRQYPKEMYYRLLAPHLLPSTVKRILYLDPDTLVINPIRPLWETDLKGNIFAAAAHTGKTELANSVNQLRLGTDSDYYNSGVLLMDLEAGRREIDPPKLFRYVEQHRMELILPDQDILNALYSEQILPLDDALWNYDARNYSNYLLRSGGICDLQWVMEHTSILHFCGKQKPWKRNYLYRFGILYRHYMQLARREEERTSWAER